MSPRITTAIGLALVLALAAACSSLSESGQASADIPGQTPGPQATDRDDRIELVFFRDADGPPRPVNIYVDHAYVASLMPGGYARVQACSGPTEIAAAYDDARQHHHARLAAGQRVEHPAGQAAYWQVGPSPSSRPPSSASPSGASPSIGTLPLQASDQPIFERLARTRQRQTIARLEDSCARQREAGRRALDVLSRR